MKLPVKAEDTQVTEALKNAVDNAKALKVVDNDSFKQAGEILKSVNDARKAAESRKKLFTKPADEIKAQAKELFDPFINEAKEVVTIIKEAMLEWQRKVDAEAAAKQAKLEARVEKGTMRLDTAVRKAGEIETADTAAAGVTKSMVRKVKIVDPKLVPERYWFIDEVAIRRDALGNKAAGIEPIDIPGVEVYEESSLGLR